MAEITVGVIKIGEREPIGKVFEQIYEVPIVTAAAADEWFTTDFSFVESVAGVVVLGDTLSAVNVQLREQGTSESETADNSAVGVESETATTTAHFAVRGRP